MNVTHAKIRRKIASVRKKLEGINPHITTSSYSVAAAGFDSVAAAGFDSVAGFATESVL
jgi:ribosome-interacting GTPase 1